MLADDQTEEENKKNNPSQYSGVLYLFTVRYDHSKEIEMKRLPPPDGTFELSCHRRYKAEDSVTVCWQRLEMHKTKCNYYCG